MGNIFNFSESQLLAFILVLIRISTFVGLWPVLGGGSIPKNTKILFALVMTMVVFPIVGWQQIDGLLHSNMIVWLAVKEIVIALAMISVTKLLFFIVNICGQVVSVTMGLSSAQVFNPSQGMQVNVVEQLQVLICSVFFLAVNGHHIFLEGLVQSFELVPISMAPINLFDAKTLSIMVSEVVNIGIKLSAPIMISIFVMNLAMGIVGRAVPQINILITSFPVNILFGFAVLIVTMPVFVYGFKSSINTVSNYLFMALKAM